MSAEPPRTRPTRHPYRRHPTFWEDVSGFSGRRLDGERQAPDRRAAGRGDSGAGRPVRVKRRRMRRFAVVGSIVAVAMGAAGCGGTGSAVSAPSPAGARRDATAAELLERVAPRATKLDGGTVTSTQCWPPSEHLLDDVGVAPAGTWRVICRVHYMLGKEPRYRDATCIGDFNAVPMLDHCYVWKYHLGGPGSKSAWFPPRHRRRRPELRSRRRT